MAAYCLMPGEIERRRNAVFLSALYSSWGAVTLALLISLKKMVKDFLMLCLREIILQTCPCKKPARSLKQIRQEVIKSEMPLTTSPFFSTIVNAINLHS